MDFQGFGRQNGRIEVYRGYQSSAAPAPIARPTTGANSPTRAIAASRYEIGRRAVLKLLELRRNWLDMTGDGDFYENNLAAAADTSRLGAGSG